MKMITKVVLIVAVFFLAAGACMSALGVLNNADLAKVLDNIDKSNSVERYYNHHMRDYGDYRDHYGDHYSDYEDDFYDFFNDFFGEDIDDFFDDNIKEGGKNDETSL